MLHVMGWTAAVLAAALLAGCAPGNGSAPGEGALPAEAPALPPAGGTQVSDSLSASLQTTVYADSVQFALRVTNTAESPVQLEFSSGQSFDFVVEQNGRELWRWSADRMFTQALRSETLSVGETRTFRATWTPPPGAEGRFRVTGLLTAMEHPVRQQAVFELP